MLSREQNQQVLSSPAFTSDRYCCHGARLFTGESAAPIVTENESLYSETLWYESLILFFIHDSIFTGFPSNFLYILYAGAPSLSSTNTKGFGLLVLRFI